MKTDRNGIRRSATHSSLRDESFVLDVPEVGDVVVCPDGEAAERAKEGLPVFSYRELEALDAAKNAKLCGIELPRAIARVKKHFPQATIDRILDTDEAIRDLGSRRGIAASDPRRQVGRPPARGASCPACGGEDSHLLGCSFE